MRNFLTINVVPKKMALDILSGILEEYYGVISP
jgi:hypothetical protein